MSRPRNSQPKVDALKTKATDLNTAAKTALGDTDGPRFTMQTVMAAVQAANPPPADKAAATDSSGKGGKGGKGMRTPITPTDDQLKTLKPAVDAVKAAVKALSDTAKTVLGDTDGPRYTRQGAMQAIRGLMGNMGGGGGGKRGGGGGGGGGGTT